MRLWQRLFLVMAGFACAVVAALLLAEQRAFERGFVGYLNELEARQAEEIVTRLGEYHPRDPGWRVLRQHRPQWFLITGLPMPERMRRDFENRPAEDRLSVRAPEDAARDEPLDPGFAPRPGRPRDAFPGRRPDAPRFAPPRPRGGPNEAIVDEAGSEPLLQPEFGGRLQLFDRDGLLVAGVPQVPPGHPAREWPLHENGAPIGSLRLYQLTEPRDGLEGDFAREQTQRSLLIAAAMLPLALLLAAWFARAVLRPLRRLENGLQALSAGALQSRLEAGGGREFDALSADFNRLAETLDAQRHAARGYFADVAHELRTPLSILHGELQAMEDGIRPLDAKGLASLQGEVQRLNRLVDDLHQLAQSDIGALAYRFADHDLGELVRRAADSWQLPLSEAGIALSTDIPDRALPIRADGERLLQLLGNLLANTLRYTDAPGRAALSLQRSGHDYRIELADSAPGVAAGDLARLFERLYRGESSRNRSRGGSGLGLAIARQIAEAHGGHIHAEASPLGGVRVVLSLPATPP